MQFYFEPEQVPQVVLQSYAWLPLAYTIKKYSSVEPAADFQLTTQTWFFIVKPGKQRVQYRVDLHCSQPVPQVSLQTKEGLGANWLLQ